MKRTRTSKLGVPSSEGTHELLRDVRRDSGLPALTAALAVRASNWPWLPVYLRWRAGERVSVLQRKWLAVTARHLARAKRRKLTEADIRAVRPWPRRDE